MNKKTALYGLILLAVLGALLFRLFQLDLRPMHHDEANQAVKFGILLEQGEYRYDRTEHHGPTLYYLSLPFAWITSGTSFSSLSEVTLRLLPVIFGMGIILLLLLFKDGFSLEAAVFASILIAVSPAMVFYSRFYIQETLLIFFLVGAVAASWRYTRTHSPYWAAAAGFFFGMMFSTKETCIIAFGAMLAALILSFISLKKQSQPKDTPSMPKISHLFIFIGTGVLVSLLLYSSFFQNPKGILDSVLAFGSYFNRAGSAGFHSHPVFYYLRMLAFSQYGNGPVWSEALILFLALIGGFCLPADFPWRVKSILHSFCHFLYTPCNSGVLPDSLQDSLEHASFLYRVYPVSRIRRCFSGQDQQKARLSDCCHSCTMSRDFPPRDAELQSQL
jgi:uncharacterized protein (TIGR03663 family)